MAVATKQPNFVLILADDQGWNGLGVETDGRNPESKNLKHQTPRIAELAQKGMRFSRAYAGESSCSPSRAALLTGRDAVNSNFYHSNYIVPLMTCCRWLGGAQFDVRINNVNPMNYLRFPTIPMYLKNSTAVKTPYKTANFGKWHLPASDGKGVGGKGMAAGDPSLFGFDEHDGDTKNIEGDACPITEADVNNGTFMSCDSKMMRNITDKGNLFMTRCSEESNSFYLQLSHYAVHWRNEFSKPYYDLHVSAGWTDFVSLSYAAMTSELDDSVGRTMDHIQDLGIDDHTYVIYTSDNGATWTKEDKDYNNLPLKGGKLMLWEGGIRVPLIIAGPNVQAGVTNDLVVSHTDLLPTIVGLAANGEPVTDLAMDLDGVNIASTLTSTTQDPSDHKFAKFFYYPYYRSGAGLGHLQNADILTNTLTDINKDRNKTYKVVKPTVAMVHQSADDRNSHMKLMINIETGARERYDLKQDIGESENLAGPLGEPTKAELADWRKLRAHMWERGAVFPKLNRGFSGHDYWSRVDGLPDYDADGLPDAWEFENLLTAAFNGSDDPDGDGLSLTEEYSNRTDPLNVNDMPYVVRESDSFVFHVSGMGATEGEREFQTPRVAVTVRPVSDDKVKLECTMYPRDPQLNLSSTNMNNVHAVQLQNLEQLPTGKYLIQFRQLPSGQVVSRAIDIPAGEEQEDPSLSCSSEDEAITFEPVELYREEKETVDPDPTPITPTDTDADADANTDDVSLADSSSSFNPLYLLILLALIPIVTVIIGCVVMRRRQQQGTQGTTRHTDGAKPAGELKTTAGNSHHNGNKNASARYQKQQQQQHHNQQQPLPSLNALMSVPPPQPPAPHQEVRGVHDENNNINVNGVSVGIEEAHQIHAII